MTPEDVAARLRAIREDLGSPSQRLAAQLFGVSEATWQRLEGGESYPKGELLVALAREGYEPSWVLTGEGNMRRGGAAVVAPSHSPAPRDGGRLFGYVDPGRLDQAFRDALEKSGLDPDRIGDTNALMLLTILLHDAGLQASAVPAAEDQPQAKQEAS